MELKDRLTAIKDARNTTWKTVADALDISEAMLFRCLSGARKPSRRFLRRIESLESGYPAHSDSPQAMVGESPSRYISRKQVNMLEVEQRLAKISGEIAAIRELIREARHE